MQQLRLGKRLEGQKNKRYREGYILLNRIKKVIESFEKFKIDAVLIKNLENIRYLSGFTGSSAMLLITKGKNFLLTDFRYIEQAKHESSGFDIIKVDDYYDALLTLVKKFNIKKLGFESAFVSYEQYEKIKKIIEDIVLIPTKEIVEQFRMIKDDSEIEIIKQAVSIADKSWNEIIKRIEAGMTEVELAIELEFIMRKFGAESKAFDIIVASGFRGALPHGVASNKIIEHGDMVTIDFGAKYKGYNSDMTRNFIIGKPTKKQLAIYEIVLEAQLAGIDKAKPGVYAFEVDKACRDIIKRYGYSDYFGHGTGHGVGLSVHEAPRVSQKEKSTVLEPGMIITIEPGIYLPDWGGVRIEDMILITSGGCEVLTKAKKKI